MKKKFVWVLVSCLGMVASAQTTALDYLNNFRNAAGLDVLVENADLTQSATNHVSYMRQNKEVSHYESSSKDGFTGEKPVDRAIYAGYRSRYVIENLSACQKSVEESIDKLMSAIYHRFAFLSSLIDEIGIEDDTTARYYTYDMGASGLNDLCANGTYSGGSYVTNVCDDKNKKIDADAFRNVFDSLQASAPDLILWPASQMTDVLPVFYEENPDPLPNVSVSGYPVSVEFNPTRFTSHIQINRFDLFDADTLTPVSVLSRMDENNDPHDYFDATQFALFPTKRLEWGKTYYAYLSYTYNGEQTQKGWCFSVRSLDTNATRVYRITDTDVSLNVVADTPYAIYLVPNDGNDSFLGYSLRYTASVDYKKVDRNTMYVTLNGNAGDYAKFSFDNQRTVKLTIADTDTATPPVSTTCRDYSFADTDGDGAIDMIDDDDDNDGVTDRYDAFPLDASEWQDTDNDGVGDNADTDDDNDGISDRLERVYGLDPKNPTDGFADSDGDGFSNALEISLGTDYRNASSKPAYTPIVNDTVVMMVPYRP